MKFKIEFLSWAYKAALEIEAKTFKEAVEKAVKEKMDLRAANLYAANLEAANLYAAKLSRANLSRATLDGANLFRATLYGANLSRATLYGANLSRATLYGATLDGATLYGATLSRANLCGATLDGAKLWRKRPIIQLGPCGSRNAYTNVFFFEDGSEPLIKTGCFSGNLEELRAAIHKTHGGTFHEREYLALADHIDAIFAIQKEKLSKQSDGEETEEESEVSE